MNKLTFAQQVIFDCIKKHYQKHQEAPTLEEICDMSGLNTISTVHIHLKNLQAKGYIQIKPRIKRGIIILKDN